MRFDASLRDRWTQQEAGWRFDIPEGWGQGRSVFGGLSVAAAAALLRRLAPEERALRSLHAQLLRPLQPGPCDATAELTRSGRSVTFAEARLSQGGAPAAAVSAVFTAPREGALRVEAPRFNAGIDPESLPELPYIEGVMPEFVKQVDMRWASGGLPYSGASAAHFTGFCRFRVPANDLEGLIGLLDVWPNPSLSLLRSPAAASTATWTAHILEVPESFAGWFAFEYETIAGAAGFHTVAGRLYAPGGHLVGWTEQLVAVFA